MTAAPSRPSVAQRVSGLLGGQLAGPTLIRLMTAPVSFVCSLLGVSVLIQSRGVADYALLTVLLSLQTLFTLMDLGTGGAVINGAATRTATGSLEKLATPLRTAVVLSTSVALGVLAVAAALAPGRTWSTLLGEGSDPRLDAALVLMLTLNVLVRPTVQFQNALIGIGGSRLVVLAQLSVPLTNLAVVAGGVALGWPLAVLVLGLLLGQLGAQVLCGVALHQRVPGLFRATFGSRPRLGEMRAAAPFAGPTLIIACVAPLYTALDRVVLNHLSSTNDVAEYSLAMQFFVPLSALFVTLQQTLWADFARRRAKGEATLGHHVARIQRTVALVGIAVGVVLAIVTPLVAGLVSRGEIDVSLMLTAALSLAFVVQLSQLPSSALLTTPTALGYQAKAVVASVVLNLTVTVALAAPLGALAPATGTLVGSSLLLWLLMARARLALRAPEPSRN